MQHEIFDVLVSCINCIFKSLDTLEQASEISFSLNSRLSPSYLSRVFENSKRALSPSLRIREMMFSTISCTLPDVVCAGRVNASSFERR